MHARAGWGCTFVPSTENVPIKKSPGVTPTERLLAKLCERSFLKLWSYPNPFKDDGAELCDLLAVFDNHVYIFFDRESLRLTEGDADLLTAWSRWKKNVIDEQIRKANGAERYLRMNRAVYLDAKQARPFPIAIPATEMIVHKIVVAHGAKEACERFSDQNVYGSLGMTYASSEPPMTLPFMVGLDKANPIHVFDSHNLPIVLSELDTFSDLTAYIEAKEAAIRKYELLSYCGEEDLLAHYFHSYDESTRRHYIGTKREGINGIQIGEGDWRELLDRDEYKRRKDADRQSYFWDELIQRTCQNALDGTLLGEGKLLDGRSAIHEMAREPRFMRRALAEKMISAVRNFPDLQGKMARHLIMLPSFFPGKAYVFLQLKVDNVTDDDYDGEYRATRRAMLNIACGMAKNTFPELHTIIGIVIDAPKFSIRNSEDFGLLDCHDWPEETGEHFKKANEGFNFFTSETAQRHTLTVQEFPAEVPKSAQTVRIGRNAPCICGSGRKYKTCCLFKGK
jgi:hypothetical protein